MSKIKHKNVREIEAAAAHYFHIKTEYFLGIEGIHVFQNQNSPTASLYVIKGTKKPQRSEKSTLKRTFLLYPKENDTNNH